jgi:hypothetical protein
MLAASRSLEQRNRSRNAIRRLEIAPSRML